MHLYFSRFFLSFSSGMVVFLLLFLPLFLSAGCGQPQQPVRSDSSAHSNPAPVGADSANTSRDNVEEGPQAVSEDRAVSSGVNEESTDATDPALFREVTDEVGIAGPEQPWPDGKYFTPEITPGGVALLDYDNDGRLDIYQICHGPSEDPPRPFRGKAPNRLFQQQADGTFTEVAAAAGMNDPGFGHGVAVGDIDNDGLVDIYVTNYGANRLYRNEGAGKFRDVTDRAGVGGEHWSSAASFFDYDRDGDLDLMVVNFATYDLNKRCSPTGRNDDLDYCGPHEFPGLLDTLYRNQGDGTFVDVT